MISKVWIWNLLQCCFINGATCSLNGFYPLVAVWSLGTGDFLSKFNNPHALINLNPHCRPPSFLLSAPQHNLVHSACKADSLLTVSVTLRVSVQPCPSFTSINSDEAFIPSLLSLDCLHWPFCCGLLKKKSPCLTVWKKPWKGLLFCSFSFSLQQ